MPGPVDFPGAYRRNMATDKQPTVIKKYANRRLYHTGTSTYVTLEDLAGMVRKGEDFVVYDAKSGEEITRSVLAQIIFEQENKEGPNLLPVTVLRQLIRFYGDSMQALVPSYLEFSMNNLSQEQQKLREQMAQAFGPGGLPGHGGAGAQEHGLLHRGHAHVLPLPAGRIGQRRGKAREGRKGEDVNDLDTLKRQMADMQAKLDKLASK